MQAISPIHAEAISPYIGRQVCAVLHDGSCIYGTISGIEGGHLLLGGARQGAYTLSTNEKRAKSQIVNRNKAKTKAFGYAYGGAYALSLALISLLFLVPFFWV